MIKNPLKKTLITAGVCAIIFLSNIDKAYAKEAEFYSISYDVTSSNHSTKKSFVHASTQDEA